MKYDTLKALVNAKVYENTEQRITGGDMNTVLQSAIASLGAHYQMGGLVSPADQITVGDEPVVFLATTPGTYTYFGGIVVADGKVALLVWSGTAWSKQILDIATRTEVSQLGQNFNNLDKLLWANATGNLDVDTTNKAFVFKNNTYIHVSGVQVYIPQNTSVSFAPFTTGSLFGLTYDNGSPVILPWANCIGKMMLAAFVLSSGEFARMTFCVLPYTIDGVLPFLETYDKRLFIQVCDYTELPYSVNADGYFGSDTKYLHLCTKVNAGDRFWICAPSINECRYAFATSDSFGAEASLPLVDGTSPVVIPTGGSTFITIPSGCNYLLCYNANNVRPFNIKRYITDEVKKIDEDIADLKAPHCSLIIGELGNVGADSNGLPDGANTQRAGMLTTVAVPYRGATLHFKLPEGYVAGIRSGAIAQNLSGNDYWFRNNQEYTFGDSANYYRIIFAIQPYPGSSYASIPAEDVMNKIKNGEIAITYKSLDAGVISRNTPSDTRVAAACFLDGTQAQTGIDKFPIFVHTTDIHGDAYRLGDAVKLAKVNNADAVLVTGDVNAYTVKNGFDALERVMLDSRVPVAFCRGNHETYGNSDTSFDVFAKYYSNLATKWGYLKASDTASDKTYYYKDFDAKKIRIIALDPYERNLTTNNAGAFSQAQIDWFIATLKSTPADYGILCILHSPEAYPSSQVSIEPLTGKTDFFIDGTPDYWSTPGGISGTPLKDIVDAFISRGTISASFTQTSTGGVSETITISGDFTTGVNTGVEFIAWVCGHQHLDLVGVYKNTTNRQVVLNMTCGVCYYGNSSYPYLCNVSDLPRNSIGVSQDAINVYAIDRTNKEIRIARIGADMTASFKKREVMTIPYAI